MFRGVDSGTAVTTLERCSSRIHSGSGLVWCRRRRCHPTYEGTESQLHSSCVFMVWCRRRYPPKKGTAVCTFVWYRRRRYPDKVPHEFVASCGQAGGDIYPNSAMCACIVVYGVGGGTQQGYCNVHIVVYGADGGTTQKKGTAVCTFVWCRRRRYPKKVL